jgi:protein-S-isoprenylcysteine O-methyltransferase Ste14
MNKLLTYRPPRIAFALLVATIVVWYFSPPDTLLYMPYKLVGSICIILGFAGLILAWLQFKRSDAAVCPTAKTSRVIMNGMYHYSRNPMYFGMLLILLGASFIMGTLPSMVAPIAFFLIIDKVFIPYEEKKLLSSFGDSYNEYMMATRRWL